MSLTIQSMGSKGEGIAHTEQGVVHVPFSLPGEVLNAAVTGSRGTMLSLLQPSPDRIKPACVHFEVCGGCAVQHWKPEPANAWKRQIIIDALAARGIETTVHDILAAAPGERRRVSYTVRGDKHGKEVGFNAAGSHQVIEIDECPVAKPELIACLPTMRDLANLMKLDKSGAGHITVTLTTGGLDVSIHGIEKASTDLRMQMSSFAISRGFARLAIAEDIIVERIKPIIHFGKVPVTPPPGGFLQASERVEIAIAALINTHIGKSKRVVDMFAGSGAFTFRNAEFAPVHAIEGDLPAVNAIDRGRRGLQGFKAITVEQRDLFRRPLRPLDLKPYDAVVFDPPRAGAEDQCTWLAKSAIKKIAAVSCNPATLARDLRILIDGGYKLKSVTPFDQFLWSPHVEAVALLER